MKLTELDKYLNKTACKTLFRNCYINVKDDSLNIIISAGNNSASCSNLLVYPKKDIICKNVSNNTNPGYANVPAVIFFDKEFNYLGCVFHSSNDDLILESSIVPEGTVFFTIQSRGSVNFQTFDCEEFIGVYDTGINIKVLEVIKELKSTTTNTATSLNSFSERILNLYSYCFKSKDLSIINLKSGVFIDKKTGTESGYGNAKVTDFISIDGKSSVKYTGSYGFNSCIAAFYNKDKKFISSIGDSDVIEKVTDYQVNLKGTEEAVYVRFSSLADEFKVLLEGADDTYIDITEINNKILDIDSKLKTATEDIDSKLETATEEINDIKENSRIKLEYAVSNIELPSNKESGFFGMIFDKEIRITSLTYMSQTIKTDNKIVVCGKEEVGDSGNTVTVKTIIPINDSQVGENTVSDLNITVEEGWSLFILGNDLFVNKGNIQEVRSSILAPGVVNAKVGDKVYYGQKLQVQKSVGITGILINVITEEYLSNLIKKYISESETSILNKTNYLNGKILCVTGDSEAAGHSIGKPASYGALIASRNNMTVYNTAENGRKMAFVEDSPGSGTPLVKAIDEIREDADYILCHIGYNDAFDESEEDDSKDITKYKGAFNTVIEGWQSRCPMARIGIIIPYYFGREETRIKRAEWMKKRCEYYHIQYIDGTIKSGLNYNSAEQKEIYFIDGVHLTRLGHEKVSYLYEQFLREL